MSASAEQENCEAFFAQFPQVPQELYTCNICLGSYVGDDAERLYGCRICTAVCCADCMQMATQRCVCGAYYSDYVSMHPAHYAYRALSSEKKPGE